MGGGNGEDCCYCINLSEESGSKKLYLAGLSDSIDITGDTNGGGEDMIVLKLNADDGSTDSTFSGNGILLFGGNGDEKATSIITYDNKIYLMGYSDSDDIAGEVDKGGRDFIILRLNPDGTLDTSFHRNGILTLGGDSEDTLNNAVIGSDGVLYLVGVTASTDIPGQPINGFNDFLLIAIKP